MFTGFRFDLFVQDMDMWRNRVDDIINDKYMDVYKNTEEEEKRWCKKFFCGDPIGEYETKHEVINVCDTAAIYEIQRSYTKRGKIVLVNGKEYPRIIRSDRCRASSNN